MPSFSENIKAPIAIVWEHFIYKIEHPEHFVPGVTDVEIIEKTADFVIRAMNLALPDGTKAKVTEKITASPYFVRFLILDHPIYMGYVDNLAEAISEEETRITFSMHWTHKVTGEPFNNQALVKAAVLKTIAFIAEQA